jgi:hypothetical protein
MVEWRRLSRERGQISIVRVDYVFVPATWVEKVVSFEIGNCENWCATGFSDHAPLMAAVGLTAGAE